MMNREARGNGALERFGQELARIRYASEAAAILEREGFEASRDALESEIEAAFSSLDLHGAFAELDALGIEERHQKAEAAFGDEWKFWLSRLGLA